MKVTANQCRSEDDMEQLGGRITSLQEVIGTCELLKSLQNHEENRSVEKFVLGPEAVDPTEIFRALCGLDGSFHLVVGGSNRIVVVFDFDTSNASERFFGGFRSTVREEPSRRFGSKEESNTENQGPEHAERGKT